MAGNEKEFQKPEPSKKSVPNEESFCHSLHGNEQTIANERQPTNSTIKSEEGAKFTESNQIEDSDTEVALLSREKDVLSQLIAERETCEYLISDLRKLRRLHQYMDKSLASKNSRTEQLKAEVHKLHMTYQDSGGKERDPNSEITSMRHKLSNLTSEVDALQQEIDTSRVDVLKEELKTLDSQMAKLQQSVMQDKIKYAQTQQRLARKHLQQMEELKQSGIKLPSRDENELIIWKPRTEEEVETERLQRQRYEEDLQRLRAKRTAFHGSQPSSYDLDKRRMISPRAKTFDGVDYFFNSRSLDDDDKSHTFIPREVVYKKEDASFIKRSEDFDFSKDSAMPNTVQRGSENTSRKVELSSLCSEVAKETTETSKVYVCEGYQRDDRCKFKDDHFAVRGKGGKHVIMRHICLRCYKNLGHMNRHPMESKLCGARVHGYESSGSPAAKLSLALSTEESLQRPATNNGKDEAI